MDPTTDHAAYVQDMFGRIARRYDLMNRLMTFGQDRRWRRFVVQQADLPRGGWLLDIATGTGDIAFEARQQAPGLHIVAADFTLPMMRVGQPMMFPLMMRNAAPLAFMFTRVDDTAQEVHLLVPMELVVSVRDAILPLMQMMMMGGGQERSQMSMEFDSEPAPVPSSEPR